MNNSQFPTARKSGLVVQEVPNEVLVFDLDSNKAHCLNDTAALVWKHCDGKTSVPEIATFITKQTGKDATSDFVWLAIDQLSENNLLEKVHASPLKGQSRREVIKKIGLASVIALPIVASLVAPRSALANVSCICGSSFDCSLFSPGDCASTTCCNAASICAPAIAPGNVCAP